MTRVLAWGVIGVVVPLLGACASGPDRLPPVTDHSRVESNKVDRSRSVSRTAAEASTAVDDDDFFRKPAAGLERNKRGGAEKDAPSANTSRIEAKPLDDGPTTSPTADTAQPAAVSTDTSDAAPMDSDAPPPVDLGDDLEPVDTVSAGSVNKAVGNLVASADKQVRSGELDSAVQTVERALRIEPKNAYLWHRMATIRLKQGQNIQAEQMAQKSLSLAARDRELQATNWKIIAAARQGNGDVKGSKAAEAKAAGLMQ